MINARIHPNSPRYNTWMQVFGVNEIPLKSAEAEFTDLPNYRGALVYFLDTESLEGAQLFRLKAYLCEKFQLTPEEIEIEIGANGVPILYDDVLIIMEPVIE